jgi:hypothetical protein
MVPSSCVLSTLHEKTSKPGQWCMPIVPNYLEGQSRKLATEYEISLYNMVILPSENTTTT